PGATLTHPTADGGWHFHIHISNSQTKSAPVFIRARGFARISFSFSVPQIEGDGAPRRRPGYPGCPVGSGLIETHQSPDAPAPLGAPYAASSAICLRTSLGPGASIVRPRGW